MESQTILIICIAFSALQIVYGQVWEFGIDNNPSAIVVSNFKGEFSFLQNEQKVQLIIPPCHAISYVRVQVDNPIASPSVFYNGETKIVSITYSIWQLSSSAFSIFAKAMRQPNCYFAPQSNQPQVPQAPNYPQVPQGQHYPQVPQGPNHPQIPRGPNYPQVPQGQHYPQVPQGQHYPQVPQGQHYPQVPQGQPQQQHQQIRNQRTGWN